MSSPWLSIARQVAATVGIVLRQGAGKGDLDLVNTVWVYDTQQFPFHRAESYHQFWDGPKETKKALVDNGFLRPPLSEDARGYFWSCPERVN